MATATNPLEDRVRIRIAADCKALKERLADLEARAGDALAHYEHACDTANAAYETAGDNVDAAGLARLAKLDRRVLDAQAALQGNQDARRAVAENIEALASPYEFDRRMRAAERLTVLHADTEAKREKVEPAPRRATVREAIDKVLAEAEGPLHYREITKRIVDRGLAYLRGSTPGATVNAACAVAAKNHDGIEKVAPGTFKAAVS